MVATPLMMLAVYTFVFGFIFKSRWGSDFGDSTSAFAMIMFCGMVVFNIFSESVNGSVGIITVNPSYVKKVVFPLEVLPVVSVLSAVFFGLVWLVILLGGIGVFMHRFCFSIIYLPLVFVPLLLFSCGISWFVASLGVYLRDLAHAIGILLQMLFFVTPICYSPEMIPRSLHWVFLFNPLAVIVQAARQVLIYGRQPDWLGFSIITVLSLIVFQLGYCWFMKTKRGFADVV